MRLHILQQAIMINSITQDFPCDKTHVILNVNRYIDILRPFLYNQFSCIIDFAEAAPPDGRAAALQAKTE